METSIAAKLSLVAIQSCFQLAILCASALPVQADAPAGKDGRFGDLSLIAQTPSQNYFQGGYTGQAQPIWNGAANQAREYVERAPQSCGSLPGQFNAGGLPQTYSNQPAGQTPQLWSGQGPLVGPPISFVDVGSGRFGKLEIDLQDGHFMEGAVERLHLTARDMDLPKGTLAALDVDVKGGRFEDFTCDQLTFSTIGPSSFDTGSLLNRRMLQFSQPVQATVTAIVSQTNLNRFLNSPLTLQRLSVDALQGGGFLGSLLGQLGQTAPLGLTFSSGNLTLQPGNRMLIAMQGKAGVGELAATIPVELATSLVLKDGWVNLAGTQLTSSGNEISPDLSNMVLNRINALSNLATRSPDIRFAFTELNVLPGDKIVLKGIAQILRLRFGRE